MTGLLLLCGASVRVQLRWAREHVYAWLVLAPLILGVSYLSAERLAEGFQFWQPSPALAQLLAAASILCLLAMSLSRAGAELYHIGQPESAFEALPVSAATHLHAALVSRLVRTSSLAVAVLLVRWLHGGRAFGSLGELGAMAVLAVLTGALEVFAALNWIHWGHTRSKPAAAAALVLVGIAAAGAGLLLLTAFGGGSWSLSWGLSGGGALAAATYFATRTLHERWRTGDIEYARRLQAAGGWVLLPARLLQRRMGRVVSSQLIRDLRLSVRRFSSAVYVVLALAALWVFALVSALVTDALPAIPVDPGWLNLTWGAPVMAIKLACLLVTLSLAALVPVLVVYQLPHLWLERASGTSGLDMWQAKLWYARLVSLPAPLVTWAAGLSTGEAPGSYSIPLLGECVWLWWLVSSLVGSLAFEMPARPALALIVMLTVALGAGLIAALFWPGGLIIYVYAIGSLSERGRARARYYMLTEDD